MSQIELTQNDIVNPLEIDSLDDIKVGVGDPLALPKLEIDLDKKVLKDTLAEKEKEFEKAKIDYAFMYEMMRQGKLENANEMLLAKAKEVEHLGNFVEFCKAELKFV